ncbi:MAG: pyruvate ferredoxin oxidoreductase [Promethearchaeota archaeon]
MPKTILISGNHAAAYACKSARVGVIAAYPITPQSPVVEKISEFVEGDLMPGTQFIKVESEHSALTAVVAASATGSRVFTASSANGLAYMFELLPWAAGTRLPVVLCVATRALGAPWSVWSEHGDIFSVRDTGWLTFFNEDNQEIYDTVLMAYKIAENPRVYLPAFNAYDGYILSHTIMPVQIEDQEKVDGFLPKLKHHINLADLSDVKGVGPVTTPNPIDRTDNGEGCAPGYYEYRFSMQRAIEGTIPIIQKINREFGEIFGRSYGNGLYKEYKMENAEVAIFAVMSVASESRLVVDKLREDGIKIGLISLKVFRPFPIKALRKAFKNVSAIIIFDRDVGYGHSGILASELKAALYNSGTQPYIKGFILGLGGRDIRTEDIIHGVKTALKDDSEDAEYRADFIGLKLDNLSVLKERR